MSITSIALKDFASLSFREIQLTRGPVIPFYVGGIAGSQSSVSLLDQPGHGGRILLRLNEIGKDADGEGRGCLSQ